MSELDQLSINTLRFLAVDAVEKAKSGHPGAPLGDSPTVYLLFHEFMRHNPAHSKWSNRDRFVLSNGHASAMLYGVLHLTGYKVAIEDLQQFRQYGSITPGHPEYGETDGVEVTTGPLGQGFAMGVGMGIAEKHLAAIYNRPGYDIVDHYTYVMCGDGDLMEGVSHEAASLAGTLGLGKLIYFYDDNSISLDGPTALSYTEDVTERFLAYHWHVQMVDDGNDLEAISLAIKAAQAVKDKPSLIRVRTVIGYGSPKAGTNKVHGEAMGPEATKETKKKLGWPEDKSFYVPDEAKQNWLQAVDKGKKYEQEWNDLFARYKKDYPELAAEFERTQAGKLAAGWEKSLPVVRRGCEADCHPQCRRRDHGRHRQGGARVDRRCSRPDYFDQDDFQRQCQLPPRSGRPQYLFRRARVWHVRGGQRHGRSRRIDSLRIDVLHLQRLLQTGASAGRADAGALAVHLHP